MGDTSLQRKRNGRGADISLPPKPRKGCQGKPYYIAPRQRPETPSKARGASWWASHATLGDRGAFYRDAAARDQEMQTDPVWSQVAQNVIG